MQGVIYCPAIYWIKLDKLNNPVDVQRLMFSKMFSYRPQEIAHGKPKSFSLNFNGSFCLLFIMSYSAHQFLNFDVIKTFNFH